MWKAGLFEAVWHAVNLLQTPFWEMYWHLSLLTQTKTLQPWEASETVHVWWRGDLKHHPSIGQTRVRLLKSNPIWPLPCALHLWASVCMEGSPYLGPSQASLCALEVDNKILKQLVYPWEEVPMPDNTGNISCVWSYYLVSIISVLPAHTNTYF